MGKIKDVSSESETNSNVVAADNKVSATVREALQGAHTWTTI